jgi:hypothetical protein
MGAPAAVSTADDAGPAGAWYGRLPLLLAVQSAVVVLVSVNRLSSVGLGYVAGNQFLRWVDLNNILLALVSTLASFLVLRHVESRAPEPAGRASAVLATLFVVATFVLGVSYGEHELTNYLSARFCDGDTGDLCRLIAFHDDEFSHWLFFAGFLLVSVVLMVAQAIWPAPRPAAGRDLALLTGNALFIGAGIFANLGFEEIGLDLYVVAAVAALAVLLLWRRGRQPLLVYYAVAYLVGLAATAAVKVL